MILPPRKLGPLGPRGRSKEGRLGEDYLEQPTRQVRRECGTRRKRRTRGERGSGSVLAVGLLGATLAVTAGVIPVLAILSVSAEVRGAADAAALAAADTASGALAGVPCEAAIRTADVNGASVSVCSLDGLIASVSVWREVAGIKIEARSRAGPPPAP